MTTWQRFRRWPWWAQTLAWLFVLPAPLLVWALSMPEPSARVLTVAVGLSGLWMTAVFAGARTPPEPAPPRTITSPTTTITAVTSATPTPSFSLASFPPSPSPSASRSPSPSPRPSKASPKPTATAATTTAETRLTQLTIKAESHQNTYDRARFKHWIDADGDGCDTRAEVLMRESRKPVTTTSTCRVVTGEWFSYYDAVTVTEASKIDIDHMVPLAEAWRSGGWNWTDQRRMQFANDLRYADTLHAVTASSNRSKGDRDPADWKPRRAVWCRYAREWINIKHRWSLTVDRAEHSVLEDMLMTC